MNKLVATLWQKSATMCDKSHKNTVPALTLAILSLLLTSNSHADKTSPLKGFIVESPGPDSILNRKNGYFILDLDAQRKVSRILILPKGKKFNKKNTADLELGPFKKGRHLVMLKLKAGSYRIASVEVPHYDLPFRYDYAKNDALHFNIIAQKTNYFTQIFVGKDRAANSLELNIRNRLSHSLPAIDDAFYSQLSKYPLRYSGNTFDIFSQKFLEPTVD